jgi:hypothetical protein
MIINLKKQKTERDQKIDDFFEEPAPQPVKEWEKDGSFMLEEYSPVALMHWRAPEFEPSRWDKRWYLGASLILSVIIIYALVANSPIMAITFILIGIVGYIFLQKKPRVLEFMITHDGIIVGQEIYVFRDIKSFWIFYEPEHIRILSLHMKDKILPYIHIPIHNENPVIMRDILLEFLPEVEQEPSLVDNLERLLRI